MTDQTPPSRPPRQVSCPQCGKTSIWSEANPWRPFCSERCKMIDLGQWANEQYAIPVVGKDDPELPDQ